MFDKFFPFIWKYLKIYTVFVFSSFGINLVMEITFRFFLEIPEKLDILGTSVFFLIFSFFGALIFFHKRYTPIKMGLLSLFFGQFLEFTFMRPEWVIRFYSLEFTEESIIPFIISSLIYWFPAWLIPSYILHRFKTKT